MQNAVSIDIITFLATNGFGTIGTANADLFAMAWGEGVDKQILVMDTGGIDTDLKLVVENPTFQILARGDKNIDLNLTYQVIRSAHEFLISAKDPVISGTAYIGGFEPRGIINSLGRDQNDRAMFSANYFTFRDSI